MKYLVFLSFLFFLSFSANAQIDSVLIDSITNVLPNKKSIQDLNKSLIDTTIAQVVQKQINKLKKDTAQNSPTALMSQQIYMQYLQFKTRITNQQAVEIANIKQRYEDQVVQQAIQLLKYGH